MSDRASDFQPLNSSLTYLLIGFNFKAQAQPKAGRAWASSAHEQALLIELIDTIGLHTKGSPEVTAIQIFHFFQHYSSSDFDHNKIAKCTGIF